jgi:hypothetical protein
MFAEVEINQHEVIVGDMQMKVKELGLSEKEINEFWNKNIKIGISEGSKLLGLPEGEN